jgi:hypothetical protein
MRWDIHWEWIMTLSKMYMMLDGDMSIADTNMELNAED